MTNANAARQIAREDGQMHVVTSWRHARNAAAQFLLEYFVPPCAATRLEEDVIHEMPPGRIKLIE
eukprot:7863725-Pyramimonas_sp.AAC.1